MPDSAATVSVILPLFDAEEHLTRTLTRLLDENPEGVQIVAVDDGSTDATTQLMQPYTDDPRVTFVRLDHNRGVAAARNAALTHATGEFVWFLDVDDDWHADFLPVMVSAAQSTGADAVLCSADFRYGPDLSRREPVVRYRRAETLQGDSAAERLAMGTGALWNKLIRRSRLPQPLFPALPSKSDHAGLLGLIPALRRITVVPDVLYTYVQRDGSISNGGVKQPQNLLALLPLAERSLARLGTSPRSHRLRTRVRCSLTARALREYWRYAPESAEVRSLPATLSWPDVLSLPPSDWKALATCVPAKLFPSATAAAFRTLGRSRWPEQGMVR